LDVLLQYIVERDLRDSRTGKDKGAKTKEQSNDFCDFSGAVSRDDMAAKKNNDATVLYGRV
jgi:hypothetical protein